MKNPIPVLAFVILSLIIVIKLAPVLSDLQTVSRGNEIIDTAKEGDINEATKQWGDLVVDTTLDELWNILWAPIIAFVVLGLIALFLFLKRYS